MSLNCCAIKGNCKSGNIYFFFITYKFFIPLKFKCLMYKARIAPHTISELHVKNIFPYFRTYINAKTKTREKAGKKQIFIISVPDIG